MKISEVTGDLNQPFVFTDLPWMIERACGAEVFQHVDAGVSRFYSSVSTGRGDWQFFMSWTAREESFRDFCLSSLVRHYDIPAKKLEKTGSAGQFFVPEKLREKIEQEGSILSDSADDLRLATEAGNLIRRIFDFCSWRVNAGGESHAMSCSPLMSSADLPDFFAAAQNELYAGGFSAAAVQALFTKLETLQPILSDVLARHETLGHAFGPGDPGAPVQELGCLRFNGNDHIVMASTPSHHMYLNFGTS